MPKTPDFDVEAAHRYFAAHCFNKAWDLIEKTDRTPQDDRDMFALNQASIYHWQNRPDFEHKHLSIGYWQASRIQTLLGNAGDALRYAEACLQYSTELDPFYLGYAYEAMARSQRLAGNESQCKECLAKAREQAALVSKKVNREALLKDLDSISDSSSEDERAEA